MMNVSSSHDAPRLATDFYNPNKYKYHANTYENPAFKTGKPDAKSMNRLRLYLMHLFTIPGAPQIWNGEEMGMWGADDPHCRKPLMWPELKFDPEVRQALQLNKQKPVDKVKFNEDHFKFYQKLIKIRKENPVLAEGNIEFVKAEGKVLIYRRYNADDEILVLFNLSDKPFQYKSEKKMINLMNGKMSEVKIVLKAESGYILKSVK
jgi:glycosidase